MMVSLLQGKKNIIVSHIITNKTELTDSKISDCGDNSDESGCPSHKNPCLPHMFQCKSDSKCIPEYFQCDHDNGNS